MTKVTAETLWRDYQATVRMINLYAELKRGAAAEKYRKAMDKLDKAVILKQPTKRKPKK